MTTPLVLQLAKNLEKKQLIVQKCQRAYEIEYERLIKRINEESENIRTTNCFVRIKKYRPDVEGYKITECITYILDKLSPQLNAGLLYHLLDDDPYMTIFVSWREYDVTKEGYGSMSYVSDVRVDDVDVYLNERRAMYENPQGVPPKKEEEGKASKPQKKHPVYPNSLVKAMMSVNTSKYDGSN